MPSPIAHIAAGYVVYGAAVRAGTGGAPAGSRLRLRLLATTLGLSMLPDADSVLGVLTGDLGRYHNNLSHSLFVAVAVALAVGMLAGRGGRDQFGFWFAVALACYGLHVVMDYFTWGRGVMALWPIYAERFSPPIVLFYGFHWSQGWLSPQHLLTVFSEVPIALAAAVGVKRLARARVGA